MSTALEPSGDAPPFVIRYDGGTTGQHQIPARHLAASLEGLDRIIVRFLFAVETTTPAKRSPSPETANLAVKAPQAGSVDIPLLAEVAAVFMPFVGSMTAAVRSNLCEHIVNYVMLSWGGRRREASDHLDKALDIIDRQSQADHEDRQREREATTADRQREREHMQQLLRDQMAFHKADAVAVARPVGKSCTTLSISSGRPDNVVIDEPTAAAISAKEEVEVTDILDMTFKVDGIELSSKTLRVFDPDVPGRRIKVHITDPAFDPLHPADNPYEDAFRKRGSIRVTGKATRKLDGQLLMFHAMAGVAL